MRWWVFGGEFPGTGGVALEIPGREVRNDLSSGIIPNVPQADSMLPFSLLC